MYQGSHKQIQVAERFIDRWSWEMNSQFLQTAPSFDGLSNKTDHSDLWLTYSGFYMQCLLELITRLHALILLEILTASVMDN